MMLWEYKVRFVLLGSFVLCACLQNTLADVQSHQDPNRVEGRDGDDVANCVDTIVEKRILELVESNAKSLIDKRVSEMVAQRVNDMLNSEQVMHTVEKRVNALVKTRVNDLVETRVNDLVETRVNDLVEKRVHDLIEKRLEDLVEQRFDDSVNKRIDKLLKKGTDTEGFQFPEAESVHGQNSSKEAKDGVENVIRKILSNKENKTVKQQHRLPSAIRPSPTTGSGQYRRLLLDGDLDTDSGKVAFSACVTPGDLTELGSHHHIIFDKAITNVGASYHPNAGLFIAPVEGVYVFQLSVMVRALKKQYLQIMRDGQYISSIYPDSRDSGEYATASNLWALELTAGSEVWIETGAAGEIHGNCFSMFSGFRLY